MEGPADWFTGTVRVDPLFSAVEPARTAGKVGYEPVELKREFALSMLMLVSVMRLMRPIEVNTAVILSMSSPCSPLMSNQQHLNWYRRIQMVSARSGLEYIT